MQHNLLQKKMFTPFSPIQGSRVCKWAEHLLAWYFICYSNLFDLQHDYLSEKKTNKPWSRVSVRELYL